jgi:hypothetical protein
MPLVGDRLVLETYCWWADAEAHTYTVTAAIHGNFGSGIGVQVSPAIQPGHPEGVRVWYDLAHFSECVTPNVGVEA